MQMTDVYRKLPGTNCGDCGMPTCIAFALKVANSQVDIDKCPHVSEEVRKEFMKAPARSSDNFEAVSDELEKEAIEADFREAADAIGGEYVSSEDREMIRILMNNRPYEMTRDGLFENNSYSKDSWAKIIIYDYIRRKGKKPLTDNWVTLGYFPDTASHVKAFQSLSEKKVAGTYSDKGIEKLRERAGEFNGRYVEGKMDADLTCRFDLLPRIPLYLCFWSADEEFDANCRLFVDSNAENYIDIEYLAYLVERFIDDFVKY